MPFNLQQPQALSDLAADGKIADSTPADTMPDSSISADDLANSDEPSLSRLDGPHVPVQVQTYVHHRVNDVFQNALEHELDQAKVDAAHKKAELENVKYEFLAEKLAKSLEAELSKYSSTDLNVWVPYEENGEEFWYPMTPKEWMQYIEELLKYKDYFEKEHPGFFKDLLNDLRAISHSLHPEGKSVQPVAPSPSVKPIVSTNVPTAAPIETVPVQVIRHLPPPATGAHCSATS
jgi:hypothetical protein